jgi:hypothetical protein
MQTTPDDRPIPPETAHDFVMRFPEDMPTEEVLRLAEAAGVPIGKDDVYLARYRMRQIRMDNAKRRNAEARALETAAQAVDADPTMPIPTVPAVPPPPDHPQWTSTEWVSKFPLDADWSEVKASAAKVGLALTHRQIRTIQGVLTQKRRKMRIVDPMLSKAIAAVPTKKTIMEFAFKSDFVRTVPYEMPAADVVKAAKKAGIKDMTLSNVYATRAQMRKEGVAVKAAGSTGRPATAKVATVVPPSAAIIPAPTDEVVRMRANLKRLVLQMGVVQAKRVFEELTALLEEELP